MSGDLDLEQRYRRVLRVLPVYYRAQWEEDMVGAFLDGWLTGDPDEDSVTMEYDRPTWPEVASVIGLAARLYLGGLGTPRRYFAWGQAVRRAVLVMALVHAVVGLDALVLLDWNRRVISWLPAAPASLGAATPNGVVPATVWYLVDFAWVMLFVALALGYYRAARVIGVLAIVPNLIYLLQGQFTGLLPSPPLGPWAFWILINLAPVLAMAAFHRDAPPTARWPWLLALPAGYLLVEVPYLAVVATGNAAWLPDNSGFFCLLVSLACLAHAPRALSRTRRAAESGVWSLTLMLVAAVAGAYRIASLSDYRHDPHLIKVSLVELLILLVTVALVTPDAARTQAAAPAPPYPHLG